jgi:DNA-binding transcriptional LysR family regulator
MKAMQFPHIRSLDLSLVEPLYALLDERHVTRAAKRCDMSQSAMSRALERLRSALDDELLVRSGGSYERTPRGDQLLVDLQALLPRLDAAVRGNRFDPATSRDRLYIATTDYAASVLIPTVVERAAVAAPSVRIEVVPWNDKVFNDIEAGRVHLALIGVQPPEPFESEPLFSDEFVCVVARDHPVLPARMTLKRYVEYGHAVVPIGRDGGQPWIERTLAANGFERRVTYRSPYQLSAILVASRTNAICTTARLLAKQLAPVANVRLLAAPRELPKIDYRMVWHRRLRDDAALDWLRNQLLLAAKDLSA